MKREEIISDIVKISVFVIYTIAVVTICVSIGRQLERVETRQRFNDIGGKELFTNQDIKNGLFGNTQELKTN